MAKDLSPYGPRHATEPTHDDTYEVAFELGVHPMHAYGHISAFRARYPLESPHGRLRDAAQIERLALWDGEPGKLAAAFERIGIVDRVDGRLVAHDHEHYAGAVLAAREAGRDRKRKQREKGSVSRVTVTPIVECDRPVTVTLTHSLTSSDPDPDPDQIASVVPEEPAPKAEATIPKPQPAMGWNRKRHNIFDEEDRSLWPKDEDEVLNAEHPKEHKPVIDVWRSRFPALDGRNGRSSLEEAALRPIRHWFSMERDKGRTRWRWPEIAIDEMTRWLEGEHTKAKNDRRVEGYRPKHPAHDDVDVDAIMGRGKGRGS